MSAFLEMRGIEKRYGATHALREVDFAVAAGEVHAIVGENGAGKSTLVKVITGAVGADAGEIRVAGVTQAIRDPLAAQHLGIRVVHQHANPVPQLSATENILLGQLPSGRTGWSIDWSAAHRRAREILAETGFPDVPEHQIAARLSAAQRKAVELAKALAVPPRLLILDEPSAALSHEERTRLFALVRRLRTAGTALVYISHDLDEVLELADRITVLRDGAVAGVLASSQASKQKLVELMVGRSLGDIYPGRAETPGEMLLEVEGLSAGGRFADVSFTLSRGEILGLYGLVGSGRSELGRCLFGADPFDSGSVLIAGRRLALRSPRDALEAGIAMLSEDRARDGLVMFQPVRHNVALANFPQLARWGIVSRRREGDEIRAQTTRLDVRPNDIERPVRTLSGGNQQKVVLAKWLLRRSQVLILDEPTWGVDIAAKQEIYRTVAGLADAGMAILMISSELPEVLGMSDRVLVMRKGRIVAQFTRREASEQGLLARATGVAA